MKGLGVKMCTVSGVKVEHQGGTTLEEGGCRLIRGAGRLYLRGDGGYLWGSLMVVAFAFWGTLSSLFTA